MTPKRRKVWIGIGVIVLLLVAIPMLWPVDEPKYNARYLTEWLEMSADSRRTSACEFPDEDAVRSIGTNALPYFLDWIDYEMPQWRLTILDNAPGWMRRSPNLNGMLIGKTDRRAGYAINGFSILGTNATSAVPALEALMKDSNKPQSSLRAIVALGAIGEPALPILKSALADTNQIKRIYIPRVLRDAASKVGTNAVLPILLEATRDADVEVQIIATVVLTEIAPEVLTNAPSEPKTE